MKDADLLKLLDTLSDRADRAYEEAPVYFSDEATHGWGNGVSYAVREVRRLLEKTKEDTEC